MTTEETTPAPRFSRGKKFSLAGGIGAIALGIGAVVALPALTSSAAYAVEPKDDGNVDVEIRNPEDAAGLEKALAEYGIQAKAIFTPDGKVCDEGRYKPADIEGSESISVMTEEGGGDSSLGFEVNPDNYKLGGDTTLVIEISEGFFSGETSDDLAEHMAATMINIGAADGEVGECVPVDAPDVEVNPGDEETADDGGKGDTEKLDDDGSKSNDKD